MSESKQLKPEVQATSIKTFMTSQFKYRYIFINTVEPENRRDTLDTVVRCKKKQIKYFIMTWYQCHN